MTMNTTTTPTSAANSDAFQREMANSQRLNALARQVRDEQSQSLAKLRHHLAERVELYCKLFGDKPLLDRDGDEVDVREFASNDHLHYWEVQGDIFYADMRYSFRGEWNQYAVCFPLRYLGDGGEAVMRDEAKAWEQKQADEAAAVMQRAEAAERARLKELLEKYGENGGV
jgi:hypothetical protein